MVGHRSSIWRKIKKERKKDTKVNEDGGMLVGIIISKCRGKLVQDQAFEDTHKAESSLCIEKL